MYWRVDVIQAIHNSYFHLCVLPCLASPCPAPATPMPRPTVGAVQGWLHPIHPAPHTPHTTQHSEQHHLHSTLIQDNEREMFRRTNLLHWGPVGFVYLLAVTFITTVLVLIYVWETSVQVFDVVYWLYCWLVVFSTSSTRRWPKYSQIIHAASRSHSPLCSSAWGKNLVEVFF